MAVTVAEGVKAIPDEFRVFSRERFIDYWLCD